MTKGLDSLGEFGIVELFRQMAQVDGNSRLGIGDDCAAIPVDDFSPGQILITTDALVEGVHFLKDKTPPNSLGHKALAVSVSDIAAMGGQPVAAFLSLGLTRDVDEAWIRDFAKGFMECAGLFGIELLGGDTVESKQEIFLNVTLLGKSGSTKGIKRCGAQPGDIIYLGRPTGHSAAGLHLLKNQVTGIEPEDRDVLIQSHLLPRPQVRLGLALSRRGLAHAMIDISDGLLQDLKHICDESGLGAEIHTKDIPLSKQLERLGRLVGHSPLDWALFGGEDYCLLFCVDPKLAHETEALCMQENDLQIWKIGTMIHGRGVKVFKDGKLLESNNLGYEHFSDFQTD